MAAIDPKKTRASCNTSIADWPAFEWPMSFVLLNRTPFLTNLPIPIAWALDSECGPLAGFDCRSKVQDGLAS